MQLEEIATVLELERAEGRFQDYIWRITVLLVLSLGGVFKSELVKFGIFFFFMDLYFGIFRESNHKFNSNKKYFCVNIVVYY